MSALLCDLAFEAAVIWGPDVQNSVVFRWPWSRCFLLTLWYSLHHCFASWCLYNGRSAFCSCHCGAFTDARKMESCVILINPTCVSRFIYQRLNEDARGWGRGQVDLKGSFLPNKSMWFLVTADYPPMKTSSEDFITPLALYGCPFKSQAVSCYR